MRRAFLRFEGELSSLKAENLKRKEEFENLSYLNEQLSKELDEVRKSSEESLKAMDDDLATVVEEIMEVRQSLANGEHPLVESESSIPRKLDPFFTEPWLEAKKAESKNGLLFFRRQGWIQVKLCQLALAASIFWLWHR